MSEQTKDINKRLETNYGRFEDGRPIWRIVFSDSQLEKKHGAYTDYTEGGIFIRSVIETREVKKYPFDKGKWILERLMPVPSYNELELVGQKTSYEPVWTFEDKDGNALPPIWAAIELVITSVHAAVAKRFRVPYKDPEIGNSPKETLEMKSERLDKLQKELFGDESKVTDALTYKEGIVVPNSYEITKETVNVK